MNFLMAGTAQAAVTSASDGGIPNFIRSSRNVWDHSANRQYTDFHLSPMPVS
jgi:hypothetical protein